jgi:hypothetical protein
MPPPHGRDARRYALGLRPPSPPPGGRPDRAPVVVLAVLIPLLVIGLGWLLYDARSGDGSSPPEACSLLSQAQVDTYVPGAVPGADGDFYHCPWSDPAGEETSRLVVTVEALPGESPRVEDAKEQYDVRRREAGTTITLPSLGDESFMVREEPRQGAPGVAGRTHVWAMSCSAWSSRVLRLPARAIPPQRCRRSAPWRPSTCGSRPEPLAG